MNNHLNKLKRQQRLGNLKLVCFTLGVTVLCLVGVSCSLFFVFMLMDAIETNHITATGACLMAVFLGCGVVFGGTGYRTLPKVWLQQNVVEQLGTDIVRVETKKAIQAGAVSIATDPSADGGLSQVDEPGRLTSTETNDT